MNDGGALDGGDIGDAGIPDGGPTLTARIAAATAVSQTAQECLDIRPFFWELGDVSGRLASGSVNAPGMQVVSGDTNMAIASASKWFYSTYWVQRTNGVLSPSDVQFFNFWSGYTNFSNCGDATTVSACLDLVHRDGSTNGDLDPAKVNKFSYGGGHMQKHAVLNGLGGMDTVQLAAELHTQLGDDVKFTFGLPQLAGGANTSSSGFAVMLRKILDGRLVMKSVLGTHAVCTDPATCPLALNTPSPMGEQWHYSVGHWVEDDPLVGDGAFSSAGAFGFYPWIDASKTWYGVIARTGAPGSGMDSVRCGRLIRKAWVLGR